MSKRKDASLEASKQEWTPEWAARHFGVSDKLGRDISFAHNAVIERRARCGRANAKRGIKK